MNVLSLFSGIGGIELGLERAGFTTVGQVECDPYCVRILEKHWPGVARHDDVRTAVEWWASQPRPGVDVVCGGFPCQDISNAGRREGITGKSSGLWFAMADVVRALRPRYVVMENVSAIVNRGLDAVCGTLAEIGYDLEWDCIPAASVGAPHRRDRWWGIAYPAGSRLDRRPGADAEPHAGSEREGGPHVDGLRETLAHSDSAGCEERRWAESVQPQLGSAERSGQSVADAYGEAGNGQGAASQKVFRPATFERSGRCGSRDAPRSDVSDAYGVAQDRIAVSRGECAHWAVEPDVGRVANGIPRRVDRLRALGNAVVPQVAELVGNMLMDYA